MSDKQKQQIQEQKEEDILQTLFDKAAEAEAEAMWEAYQAEVAAGTAPEVPEELDAKCQELICTSGKKGRRIRFLNCTGIGLNRAAILVLVCLCVVSTLAMSVDAVRIPVMNLFVSEDGRFSTAFFGIKGLEEEPTSDKVRSARLPYGFELILVQELPNGGNCYHFEDGENGMIQVTAMISESMLDFDTEDAEQVSTTIYDWPAIYVEKKGYRVIWFNSDLNYVYDVRSVGISEEQFWEYIYRLAG